MRVLRWLEAVAVAAVCLYAVYANTEYRKNDREARKEDREARKEDREAQKQDRAMHEKNIRALEDLDRHISQMQTNAHRIENALLDYKVDPMLKTVAVQLLESYRKDALEWRAQLEEERRKTGVNSDFNRSGDHLN